ncbi:MAG TPA: DUF4430 domain-containing protein [Candidatus Paceibacterota bacterium]
MSKNNFSSLWMALGMLALVVAVFAGVSGTKADTISDAVASAVAYVNTQVDEPTKTMALVASSDGTVGVDVSYLQSFSGSTAIEYAKPIMAIAAAGEDPATYAQEDLVAKLKGFSDGTQMGSASQVNDDIWAILALRAAGVASADSVIQNSKAFVLGNQNANGGWAWNVGGTSDTNDTAVAIMALLETGMSGSNTATQNAVAYLKSAQNQDGGFPYDPVSEFGTESDGNSDAWVTMAFNKLGESTSSVVPHLLSLQDTDGGFWWMPPPASFNNKGPTADAIIALSGKSYPVAIFGGGTGSDNDSNENDVMYRIVGSAGEICKGAVAATNAMEVVIQAADECGYTYDIQDTSFGQYLAGINNDTAEGLNGWMYAVNGQVPSIGAADYSLSGGEQVAWFFGEFGDEPPSGAFEKESESVSLSVEVVEGNSGEGGQDDQNDSAIAFSVNPSAVDFGQLAPGTSASSSVTVANQGQADLDIEVEVQGDPVFNFLKLDTIAWGAFSALLSSGAEDDINLQLAVPAGFNVFGQKQGSLIFWASAHE